MNDLDPFRNIIAALKSSEARFQSTIGYSRPQIEEAWLTHAKQMRESIAYDPFAAVRTLAESAEQKAGFAIQMQQIRQSSLGDISSLVPERLFRPTIADAHEGHSQLINAKALLAIDRTPIEAFTQSLHGATEMARAWAAFGELDAVHARTAAPQYDLLHQAMLGSSGTRATIQEVIRAQQLAFPIELTQLVDQLDTLTAASEAVWREFRGSPSTLAESTNWLRKAPAIQLYAATRGTGLLIGLPEDALPYLDQVEEALKQDLDAVEIRLAQRGAAILSVYRGAVAAVHGRVEDYVRHATTSMRELLKTLLNDLAPEDRVRAWTQHPEHYRDGQVSKELLRKGRLHFLYRNVKNASYGRSVDDEVNLILQTFHVLNEGTHEMPARFTDLQMNWLLTRVRAHLLTILEIADLDGSK